MEGTDAQLVVTRWVGLSVVPFVHGCADRVVSKDPGKCGLAASASAQGLPGEGRHLDLVGVDVTQAAIERGSVSLREIRRQGQLIFSVPFNKADGYGDGPGIDPDPTSPGGRPTLQDNGTFLRVNGLDAQSCLECHAIVSNRSVPATFGVGGVGGAVSNAMLLPLRVDPQDGTFDGRFINPPFLFGSGGVQLLAQEMTLDLRVQADAAEADPDVPVALATHGVSFGTIVYESASGDFDLSGIEGIDDDLVVRPFGRKGEFHTVRDFALGALIFHFGIQPVEIVGPGVDGDDDGVADEISVGEVSALEIFSTTLTPPVQTRLDRAARAGRTLFEAAGCSDCHIPFLETRGRILEYRLPEDPGAAGFYSVNLSRAPVRFAKAPKGSLRVPLFADLKRHHMGPDLAENFGSHLDAYFTTARLWGIWDTAPYLHDGRATTLVEAITLHGGEAQPARDHFVAFTETEKAQFLAYLATLRTPKNATRNLR
ncbi:MAG: hypothetical protein JRD03_12665 [Deltaproteobacteria bacterium]|nr:hypothetical protein [Deltaproteobacteria bacterium]